LLLVAVVVDYHGVHNLELAAAAAAVESDPVIQELLHQEEEVLYQFQILLVYIQLQLVLVEQVVDLIMVVEEDQMVDHLHSQLLHLLAVVLVVAILKVLLMVDLVAVATAALVEDRVILHQHHHLKVI